METSLALKATLKEIGPCEKELHVELPAETVSSEFEEVYKQFKKFAAVPGFRIGFAPRDLLERYHGVKVQEEVVRRLVGRSLDEALESQKKLDVVGRPHVSDLKIENNKPLSYVAHLEISPEVPVGPYKKLKLTRAKADLSDKAINQILERIQEQQAQLVPVAEDRAAQEGDFLMVDLTESRPKQSPRRQKDMTIQLKTEKDPEGVLKGLIGIRPSETRTFKLKDEVTLTVQLKAIKSKQLPAINDELAKTAGAYETLDKLKEAIRTNLQVESEAVQRRGLEDQIVKHLTDEWNFEVPPSLVASQARRNLKERAMELLQQGLVPDQVQQQAGALTDIAKLEALKQIKLFFSLRKIALVEKLEASEKEIQEKLQSLATRFNATPEAVRQDLEQRDLMEELIWNILRAKVFDLLVKEAEIKEE
jgi:trigger factor